MSISKDEIANFGAGVLAGIAGYGLVHLTTRALRKTEEPKSEEPKSLHAPPPVTLFREGTKGHLYRIGYRQAGAWTSSDSVALVDELMALRLKEAPVTWTKSGDNTVIEYGNNRLYLTPAPHIRAPDQIGEVFVVRDDSRNNRVQQVTLLLTACEKVIDQGRGVEIRLESLV